MKGELDKSSFYSGKYVLPAMGLSIAYALISISMVGLKAEQVVLLLIFNSLFFYAPGTRRFILGFSIFIIYWILYDYMKVFPNYSYNKVHIEDIYETEHRLFGVYFKGFIITPNEYWVINGNTFLDVATGFFYLMWVPLPLAFAVYLYFKCRKEFICFSLTFLWVNLLGFVVYYLYPAAPPWYVQAYGFDFIAGTKGSTAGLAGFDRYFDIHLFEGIYSKGSNVFAAMPSLHSAYPVIVLYYGLRNRLGNINIFFLTVLLGIWFSAVYTGHHYLLDVSAGLLCAVIAIISFNYITGRSRVKALISQFAKLIHA